MNSRRKQKILKRLHAEQAGLCKWCGKPCYLHGDPARLRPSGKLSGKAATIDHVYHRSDPRRREPGGYNAVVMACATCNRKRGLEAETARRQAEPKLPRHYARLEFEQREGAA